MSYEEFAFTGPPLKRKRQSLVDIKENKHKHCSTLFRADENNVLLPTLFNVVNNMICQQYMFQCCFHINP